MIKHTELFLLSDDIVVQTLHYFLQNGVLNEKSFPFTSLPTHLCHCSKVKDGVQKYSGGFAFRSVALIRDLNKFSRHKSIIQVINQSGNDVAFCCCMFEK